jgi:O-antigen ligase
MDAKYSKGVSLTGLLLCFYLAAPLYPIPIVGLSWSLPLLGILLVEAVRRSGSFRLRVPGRLLSLLLWLCGSLAVSFGWNYAANTTVAAPDVALKYIAQFLLLSLACVIGYSLFASGTFARHSVRAFASGIAVVSLFVLGEHLVLGGLRGDGWSHLTRMSQNSYAVQYSTFLPFLFGALATSKKRIWWTVALVCCLAAVLVNSSRTAWGTTLLTALIFLVTYAVINHRAGFALTVAVLGVLSLVLIWSVIPARIVENVTRDYETFENLQGDKSWMIRRLQVQKAGDIFEDHPLLGVGPGQFRFQTVELGMPDVLASRSAFEFNDVSAHNSYIQFLAEGGLLFTVPYVAFLLWLALAGFRASVNLLRRGEIWGLCLYASLAGMSVHFWTIAGLTTTGPWFLYGATAALIYQGRLLRNPAAVKPTHRSFAARS